jgi:hypothetical protein
MRRDLLKTLSAAAWCGKPHTTDQFGLADIQRGDPGDDFFLVVRLG